ncbi:DUF6434 domain-containing protein [Stutzerimonas xanthomarina]|uniref:DUF6434 domain-containing protein n=1 Tax=Stutzerimonas xanthomarina TaxID=271420 RepID=UPI003AA8D22F
MTKFDWHSDLITNETVVTERYRNTQNVRRFMTAACGSDFKFDRAFMAWVTDGTPKSMGQVAREWLRRNASEKPGTFIDRTCGTEEGSSS